MLIEIKSWLSGAVIQQIEADTLAKAVELLVARGADLGDANLRRANLRGADLRRANLRGANLRRANLGGADLGDADLRAANLGGADLRAANLRGADLSAANLGAANLRRANLRRANLRGADLSDADLRAANLRGADLSAANLGAANLRGADLGRANLRGADLGDADLRAANRYLRVPNLHNAILGAIADGGTLDMSTWHTCETAHCRAGWTVHLAGNAGGLLESMIGTPAAAAFIIQASCPWIEKVPDFYADNETALADIKACAERELIEAAKETANGH